GLARAPGAGLERRRPPRAARARERRVARGPDERLRRATPRAGGQDATGGPGLAGDHVQRRDDRRAARRARHRSQRAPGLDRRVAVELTPATRPEQTRARYPDAEGYVERDGVRVFYEVYGEGEPTILLLPTWSVIHSRHWKMQIPYLARHCRVLTF